MFYGNFIGGISCYHNTKKGYDADEWLKFVWLIFCQNGKTQSGKYVK